jgi:hypothetical protein
MHMPCLAKSRPITIIACAGLVTGCAVADLFGPNKDAWPTVTVRYAPLGRYAGGSYRGVVRILHRGGIVLDSNQLGVALRVPEMTASLSATVLDGAGTIVASASVPFAAVKEYDYTLTVVPGGQPPHPSYPEWCSAPPAQFLMVSAAGEPADTLLIYIDGARRNAVC